MVPSPRRRRARLGRWLVLGLGLGAVASCIQFDEFQCQDDGDCVYDGRPGQCRLAEQTCIYPDETCPTRWSTADGENWECHLPTSPWAARQYHETTVFDDNLWVLEGYDGANRNDVWFSPDGKQWTELPDTPWAPRHAASVVAFDDALWVIAGNNMESDVWKLVRR